jgi:hypothetical protein
MESELVKLLGMRLDDVAKSPLVVAFPEPGHAKMVHDRLYLEYPNSGIAFDADLDGNATTVFLYAEGYRDYKGFAGDMPEGISFTDDRRAVHARMGQPSASGGGTVIQSFGKAPRWDRFDRHSYSVHVQYVEGDGSVNLVSLMRPDSIPK